MYTDNFGIGIRLWSATKQFLTGKETNGLVNVRGLEAGRGFTEIRAVGTDSSVLRNSGFEREALEMWGKAITPDEKFRAIKDIERRAFEIQVAHYVGRSDLGEQMKKLSDEDQRQVIKDLDSLRLDMYAQIDKRRAEVLRIARDPKRAYATMIDPEDGVQIVFDKRLRSQLSVAEPMLDMKVLQKTARLLVDDFAKQYDVTKDLVEAGKKTTRPGVSKRQGFRTGGVNALDTGLSLWKASVLVRLGYTQRNLFENSLRAVATIGVLPMIARMPGGVAKITNNTYKRGKNKTVVKRWNRLANEEAEKIANFKARIARVLLVLMTN